MRQNGHSLTGTKFFCSYLPINVSLLLQVVILNPLNNKHVSMLQLAIFFNETFGFEKFGNYEIIFCNASNHGRFFSKNIIRPIGEFMCLYVPFVDSLKRIIIKRDGIVCVSHLRLFRSSYFQGPEMA